MYRQSHHVEIRTFQAPDADIPDPFLGTVCAGFVVRFVMIEVIFDLILRKGFEINIGPISERPVFITASDANAGDHTVHLSGKGL
jgi:hypothetical protein